MAKDNQLPYAPAEDHEYLAVKAFNIRFGQIIQQSPGHLTQRKLRERAEFLAEEIGEFIEAAEAGDMALMFDALLDIVYVAKGTAVMMGLPWAMGFAEVHRTNMAKVPGITKRGNRVDVAKPEGWTPPRLHDILGAHGYGSEGNPIALDDDCYLQPQEGPNRG
jgi:predicted HAD superfamily Cof-like phosphohydrolase